MNTAARMESTGVSSQIQLSQETAELLAVAGKSGWFRLRKEAVYAKGKGELKTFFLNQSSATASSQASSTDIIPSLSPSVTPENESGIIHSAAVSKEKKARYIRYICDMMLPCLKEIATQRRERSGWRSSDSPNEDLIKTRAGKLVIDEVAEIVELPKYNKRNGKNRRQVELPTLVYQQLESFVTSIAMMYRDTNPFHNFEVRI